RSRNTPTPTTPYVLIGSTLTAKSRSRFSVNSAARRWRSRRKTTNRADLSIAAETASYLGYLLFAQTCRSFSATSPRRHGRLMKPAGVGAARLSRGNLVKVSERDAH